MGKSLVSCFFLRHSVYSLFNFIPRIFSILKTTTGRTLRLCLKIEFDTDLTPNITRHSCIISAELVVGLSSFINNLVRLSSIVPFHIIYQVNLYWRNNSANKYNYFETLFHTSAFHTNFSRIFHPCNLVPHFAPLQVGAANSCLAFSVAPYCPVTSTDLHCHCSFH